MVVYFRVFSKISAIISVANSVFNERGDKCHGRTIYLNLCASRLSVWVKAKRQKRSHLRNHCRHTEGHDHSSFYQFLQMEHSHKNTDCYFFYYSTCTKGDNCPFRHEPSALGCETMCVYWKQGKCLDEHCNFRHMELRKNRKSIPCYWETQPGGCRKPHCSFMHKNARTITSDPINPVKNFDLTSKTMNQEWSNRQDDTKYDGSSTESDQGRGSSEAGSFIGSPAVDPLIVKFEEESDNESVPSPVKPQPRVPYCKTYEEIRLEEIQAESAAYYSYQTEDYQSDTSGGKIKTCRTKRICLYPSVINKDKGNNEKGLDFEVLTLDEIRRRKTHKDLEKNLVETNKSIGVKRTESKSLINEKEELTTTEFLKEAMNTLTETISARGIKRRLEEDCEEKKDTSRRKVNCNVDRATFIVTSAPPVKLNRRSPRRFISVDSDIENRKSVNKTVKISQEKQIEENNVESIIGRNSPESTSVERLNSEQVCMNNRIRKNEVEIRLCDSSTDEDQMPLEKNEEKKSIGTFTVEDSKETCDSLLNINEEDYLTLDMASDDILKDIDALLKEKPSV
ncbi:zinc finger CCCH domain-containing protein 11A [Apis mellifera]|uniref:Zinc finger CCCH domain-containing protein 11A n=1 Tax=Apis mellifera TaxID=7460 RepID=A0A7M7GRJ3_APIME|nr:zinc finger CCCH domain-containing protein 11A [Apis mellifera]|eukprot:XP_006559914.2 zinc finger CCCH domain-containing protein 11A [Apis mellifera]